MIPKDRYRCVIWGGYAWGNTGDELCLAAALERARREFGDSVVVLSPRPDFTARLFPEVHVVPCRPNQARGFNRRCLMRMGRALFGSHKMFAPASEWKRCLYQAERLYLAGGGYLSDIFGLDQSLRPLELAAGLGLHIATAPVGIGPIADPALAGRLVRALSRAEVQVRDPVSLDFCQKHGLKAVLMPDDAFAVIRKWPATPASGPVARPPKIGVCIVPQAGRLENRDFSDWWVECLRGLKAQHPRFGIEGFCFHNSLNEEVRAMTRLFPRAGLPASQMLLPDTDFRRATLAVREYDFIIATRFHAVVAANVFNIPNLAIASGPYYTTKMRAAASGYESNCQVVNPDELSPENFLELCRNKIAPK